MPSTGAIDYGLKFHIGFTNQVWDGVMAYFSGVILIKDLEQILTHQIDITYMGR